MIVRLENPQAAKGLFGNWQEAVVWSCLQDIMGAVYADAQKDPKSAMAVSGDFCFLAGRPDLETALYKPDECDRDFIIMIPQSEEWADIIRDAYGERAKPVTRYAIKKEGDIFDRGKLKGAVNSLESGFTMRRMDEECFALCRAKEWSRDLVSQFPDYASYEKLGAGVAVLEGDRLVCGASSYVRYRDGIEIEIDTQESYRRRGLAYACGAGLILLCMERGLYPGWDAQNPASVALAEKLGYHFDHEYPAFEIWGY